MALKKNYHDNVCVISAKIIDIFFTIFLCFHEQDLTTVQKLLKKHQLLEADVQAHLVRPTIT